MTDFDGFALDFLEQMDSLLSVVDGYRAKLRAHGFSDDNAEEMCVEFHNHLIAKVFAGSSEQ